jgi:hemoglobin-like flavoprotein
MTPQTIHHVQSSWAQVLPIAPQAATIFYGELFARDPSLRTLFKGDMQTQGTRLMQMIGAAVGQLNRLDTLLPVLQGLGQRHTGYGVVPRHYAIVGAALLATLAKGLGPAFTVDVEAAWSEVYGVMSTVMCEAGAPQTSDA